MSAFLGGFNAVFVPFFWGALGIGVAIFIILIAAAIVASIWMKLDDVFDPVPPHPGYHAYETDPLDLSGRDEVGHG